MNYIRNIIESLNSDFVVTVNNTLDEIVKSGLLKYDINCE